ncbi:MAG: phosphodiester glycosidase family protein [Roseovarius sp.]|nr:phosphodiester glycosidase family protein [Roseovarius sp.]
MRILCLLLLLGPAVPAAALECGPVAHEGAEFTVCRADAAKTDLRLFLNDPETGEPLGSFANLRAMLARDGLVPVFAMNAGMYHQDRSPVGYYVEDGTELAPLIRSAGPGNFGLLPNGVLCIGEGWARVIETGRLARERPACRFASQSGPMLVIDGELHPRFLPQSDSLHVRNGVGTSADGRTVWFAISRAPVSFHRFGTLFRDALGAPQALYFDGSVSRLYAPGIGRHDGGFPMGPMVGAVVKAGD